MIVVLVIPMVGAHFCNLVPKVSDYYLITPSTIQPFPPKNRANDCTSQGDSIRSLELKGKIIMKFFLNIYFIF
jgi:hypothetical protein